MTISAARFVSGMAFQQRLVAERRLSKSRSEVRDHGPGSLPSRSAVRSRMDGATGSAPRADLADRGATPASPPPACIATTPTARRGPAGRGRCGRERFGRRCPRRRRHELRARRPRGVRQRGDERGGVAEVDLQARARDASRERSRASSSCCAIVPRAAGDSEHREIMASVGLPVAPAARRARHRADGLPGRGQAIRVSLRQLPAGTCAWLKNEYATRASSDGRAGARRVRRLSTAASAARGGRPRRLHDLGPHRSWSRRAARRCRGRWCGVKVPDTVRVDGVVTVVDCANFIRINNFSHRQDPPAHRPRPQQGRARRRRPSTACSTTSTSSSSTLLRAHAGRGGDRPRHHLRPRRGAPASARRRRAAAAAEEGGGGARGDQARPRRAECSTCPRACRAAGSQRALPRGVDARRRPTSSTAQGVGRSPSPRPRPAARAALPPPTRGELTKLGDVVALQRRRPPRSSRCAPAGRRRRLQGRRPLARQGEARRRSRAGGRVQSAGTLAAPKPTIKAQFGQSSAASRAG